MGTISEFGEAAAALDEAEEAAGNRIGGPTAAELRSIRRLQARVAALQPETADDWRHVAGKLARALVNGLGADDAMPMIQLAGDPATVGCG